MAMYGGVGGARKELSAFPVGIGGAAKSLDAVYGGVSGAGREIFSAVVNYTETEVMRVTDDDDDTYTVPTTGMYRIRIYAAGGGGAGNISSNVQGSGGETGWSGAAGGLFEQDFSFVAGDSIYIETGAGGYCPDSGHSYQGSGYDGGDSVVEKNGSEIMRAEGAEGGINSSWNNPEDTPIGYGTNAKNGVFGGARNASYYASVIGTAYSYGGRRGTGTSSSKRPEQGGGALAILYRLTRQ